jgi:hypothetical protein
MRFVRLATGVLSIVCCGALAALLVPIEQLAPAIKPTPLILASPTKANGGSSWSLWEPTETFSMQIRRAVALRR